MDDSHHSLDSFTQGTGHFSDCRAFDQLSEEVKLKPTKPIEFMRSHSSEMSSPARSLSSLSPNKDRHHSLSSHDDGLYPTSPLSDRPLLESASPGQ